MPPNRKQFQLSLIKVYGEEDKKERLDICTCCCNVSKRYVISVKMLHETVNADSRFTLNDTMSLYISVLSRHNQNV